MRKKGPTLDDVARLSGVSAKTVSRVVNLEPNVSDHVTRLVRQKINELGYVPSQAARQMASKRSFIIVLLFGNVNTNYITDFMLSISTACRDRGYHLICEPVDIDDETTRVTDRAIASVRPDGVILLPPLSDRLCLLEALEKTGIPVARIAGVLSGYGHCIRADDERVSFEVVNHLIKQGHRRIGFILPRVTEMSAAGRTAGYRTALKAAGIAYDIQLVVQGNFLFESGVRAGLTLLNLATPPTAIFAANDEMALGVLAVARQRGLDVPAQLAIAGFDDSHAGQMAWPPLTTVRQPISAIAAYAIAALLDEANVEPLLRYEVVVRQSTQT